MQDWKCPRSRYWAFEYLGRGLVKTGTTLELFIGIVVHDAMAAIATFYKEGVEVPIDQIAEGARLDIYNNLSARASVSGVVEADAIEFAHEQAALTEGIIRGFYKHVWPRLMTDYKIVAVETEMEYQLGETDEFQFIFMTKPDLIVEDREGSLVYIEYKTTSSKKEGWINSWETAVQLHSSIMAAEKSLGRRPEYVQIVGMYKGYESYGKQSSPFCYAYKKSGNPPFTKDIIQYEYKPGFKRTATWEMDGGVKDWVAGMSSNTLADQFPLTAPIMVNEDLIKSFFKQRLARENQIAISAFRGEYDDPITGIDTVYPQRFDQCVPSFGYSCPFKKLCFGQVNNPLQEGFELRTPHHERELTRFEADPVNHTADFQP